MTPLVILIILEGSSSLLRLKLELTLKKSVLGSFRSIIPLDAFRVDKIVINKFSKRISSSES